ncbi:conserved hypothetical protein [Ricinus communis]|uniref:Uncharacterized protein n=1 Tax=Ricinus communis TaxID=3988 RepID=B9RFP2_RICCO|nr:conserved hypothetical protein [Ricinus communis]
MTPMSTPSTREPLFSGRVTPEIQHKIENASPKTATNVAFRMYESMKRHGLRKSDIYENGYETFGYKVMDGYFMPGSVTLLLGPPGRRKKSTKLMMEGEVMYDDKHALDVCLSRLIAYISGQLNNLKEIQHKLTGDAISVTDRQRLITIVLALQTYSVMLYNQPFSGSDLAATCSLLGTA